jgi:phosphate transport system permease protein
MLGLAIFVRALENITQGRTIISAGMTLALLILPIIIVSAQEALRAVSNAIREASYGLGATKWQTISRQVLPAALPGILTGTILAMSRAIGETAPLIIVGASAFISVDPEGPFSQFTAVPILVYNWTSEPNDQFRNIAAAAIVVLLALLLTMNSTAIILRNRASNRRA